MANTDSKNKQQNPFLGEKKEKPAPQGSLVDLVRRNRILSPEARRQKAAGEKKK